MRPILLLSLLCLSPSLFAEEAPPRSLDPRLAITLFAENPQIVTPTGLDVDEQGTVWAIESNTHFPPKDYKGHPSDRLLVFRDTDGDGRAESPKVFLDGLKHTMSVAVRPAWLDPIVVEAGTKPADRQVFVATRREILLLEDVDGDDRCDRQTRLVWLDTKGDYPHNGLAGFAFDPLGKLFFGFGENLGEPYAIHFRGAPDQPIKGGGEGGNIYRMNPDGTEMTFWATGFWNPHASCIDAFGQLFTVDNDPDSRPPCRLLHVIRGGDYGYRFRNGRKGLHPFTAWNGELPGTLPMVAGTGEAPSGVLAYENDAFPEEYLGNLMATSWGDHRIDRFRLKPKGASVESVAEPFIVGGETFRPVGIALAPDGSLYCTDWVKRDYQLHGHGRIWRVHTKDRAKKAAVAASAPDPKAVFPVSARRRQARSLVETAEDRKQLVTRILDRRSPTRLRMEAVWALASSPQAAADFPFTRTPEAMTEIRQHFDDPVYQEVVALAEVPQFGFPDDAKVRFNSLMKELSTDENMALHQMRSLVLGAAQLIRQRTGDWKDGPECYQFGMYGEDPFVTATAIDEMIRTGFSLGEETPLGPHEIIHRGLLHRRKSPRDAKTIQDLLANESPPVRRFAVQWAAEEKLTELRPGVAKILESDSMTADLFLATLAALEMLDGRSPQDFDKTPPGKYVLPLLQKPETTDAVRTQALKLLGSETGGVPVEALTKWAESQNDALAVEAVRSLATVPNPAAEAALLRIAQEEARPKPLRLEAILGLASRALASSAVQEALLARLSKSGDEEEQVEILRTLRPAVVTPGIAAAIEAWFKTIAAPSKALRDQEQLTLSLAAREKPTEIPTAAAWLKTAGAPKDLPAGDAARGRRVFFHPEGPGCVKCHVVDGRGGAVGPNLSRIGGAMTLEKLIESILDPSREVSPQFTSWTLVSIDGQVLTGMIVHENEGTTVLGDSTGKTTTVKTADVEERVPQKTSVMPEKLAERMTRREFLDLIAFLESLR
ncbi:PVC-type heme-binding CxxCH protein [Planctomyces sp. SH-PL14]|uniref:PVC-type heme-binding CxxCH protein n=1 Tax=Planctomyces sp. SH-PL14 TaxID=1632864 RepID=UPI00078DABB2|nr:PVC-type heme-binding CxxCH protein [Planctomyces sp. SH-PL14]AMV21399.1 Cytochrome c [Planctomyces sp. SH-PL14]